MCREGKFGLCVHVCDIGSTCYDVFESLQDGSTALILASNKGHLACVKVLLDKGVEGNMQNLVSAISVSCCVVKLSVVV